MLTQLIFTGIVVCVILQRLWELQINKRNIKYSLAHGGKKHSDNLLGLVKVLQISWFLAMIGEVWLLNRPFIPILAIIALLGTIAGQVLRYLSMKALKRRWTLPIITIPSMPVVNTGIYKYLRHPNWLGVILEIFSLPLIHGAYITAILFTIANAWVMTQRIYAEEQALNKNTNYDSVFSEIPRFIPKLKV